MDKKDEEETPDDEYDDDDDDDDDDDVRDERTAFCSHINSGADITLARVSSRRRRLLRFNSMNSCSMKHDR